jgi:phage terminase small subunit
MPISKQYLRVIDDYLITLNAQKTGVNVGYKETYARQTVYKILQKPEVKAELERRFKASRVSQDEIIARLEAMAAGDLPTKRTLSPSRTYGSPTVKEEYDTKAATDSLGRVYALFVDKSIVEIDNLEIIDSEDSQDQDSPTT